MQNKIWMVCGKSGCGKSWLGRWILNEYQESEAVEYIVVIDNSSDHFYGNLERQDFFLQEYGEAEAQIDYNWEEFIRQNERVVIEVTNLTQEEITGLVDKVSRAVYNLGNALLVIDEAHFFFPVYHSSVELERLLRGGRKKGVDIMLISQTLVDLNLIALRLANILILFQTTEGNELDRAQQYFAIDKQKIFNLRDREYLFKDLKTSMEFQDNTNLYCTT